MNRPFKIVNQDTTSAEIYLYGMITSYSYYGDTTINIDALIRKLENMRANGLKKITFFVNSAGGEVPAGITLFNYLARNGFEVHWVIDGIAASMAAMFMLGTGTIEIAQYAKMMYHRVSGSAWGNSDELRSVADTIDTFEADLIDILAGKTKLTNEQVKSRWFDGKDHWLSSSELLDLGIVNKIIPGRPNIKEAENLQNTSDVYNHYQTQLFNVLNFNQIQTEMKNAARFVAVLATMPGISVTAEADEEAIYNAVTEAIRMGKAASAEVTAKDAKITELQNKLDEQQKAKVKNLIDKAIADKKFTEEMREVYTNFANSNFDGCEKAINTMPSVGKVVNLLGNNSDDPTKDYAWEDFQKKAPKALADMKVNDPERFKALYKAKFGSEPSL